MAVPTTIADLSTTAASNSPAATDTVIDSAGPDDYLRAHAAIIATLGDTVDALDAATQPLDAQLTTLAGITAQQASDLASLSTFVGTILNDANGDAVFTTLGAADSQGTSGYQKLPSGLIIQYGTGTTGATGTSITFPIAYPTAAVAAVALPAFATARMITYLYFTTTGCSFYGWNDAGTQSSTDFSWISIGY